MDAETYPDADVAKLINDRFVPVKLHVVKDAKLAERFEVVWTPTIIIADADGTIHHEIVGFLPPDEFRAQLEFGIARVLFNRGSYIEASSGFKKIVAQHPKSTSAPQAQYWLGVSEYKRTGSAANLKAAWRELLEKYPDSVWATKVSYIKEK